MDCERGEDRTSGRACLLLSLIFLVGNIVVSIHDLFVQGPTGAGSLPVAADNLHASDLLAPVPDGTVAPPNGSLTARQKFLLGTKVDINRASAQEISELPGISDAVAEAVVERRLRKGPYRKKEDLLKVRGIKEKRLKKILPFLVKFPNN